MQSPRIFDHNFSSPIRTLGNDMHIRISLEGFNFFKRGVKFLCENVEIDSAISQNVTSLAQGCRDTL